MNLSNLYVRAAGIFVATGISDFIWAKYMASIADKSALVAANWSVLVIALGAFIVVSYVEDKRLILPACLGAWIGTYLAV